MQSQLSLQFLFGIKWLHCATLHFVNLITCSLPQCSKSTVGNLLHLDSFTCHAILLHPNFGKLFCSFYWKDLLLCSLSDSRYWPHLCCTASCQGWPRSWKRTSINFEQSDSICHILQKLSSWVNWYPQGNPRSHCMKKQDRNLSNDALVWSAVFIDWLDWS